MLRLAVTVLACSVAFVQSGPGRPATDAEIKAKDLTIMPNGAGLPKGHGDAKQGQAIFKDKCEVCHNEKGEGRENQYPALAGGIGSLSGSSPKKTVGSYWPYATTLFDYVRRAMPYDHPRSLSTDEVYAVSAFVLYLNGIVKETEELNEKTLPQVKMPNRDGFVPDSRPDVKSKGQ
jgi:cytochrome c